MAGKSRLSIAKADIVELFKRKGRKIYRRADIDAILAENRAFWRLANSTSTIKFIEYLLDTTVLTQAQIPFPRPETRFVWGDVPTFTLIQSINPTGYFSHYTAIYLNGLTEQLPVSIYFNQEQQLSAGGGVLTQTGISNAFRGKGRVTSNVAEYRDYQVYLLAGANTGNAGVAEITTTDGQQLRVTSVERTLIDATVRAYYAGGIFEVAKAFERAHSKVSINRLLAILREINYTYPYHQAIGFYLQRTGLYKQDHVDLLKSLPIEFDFYLDYDMKDPEYVKEWRLFVPKGF